MKINTKKNKGITLIALVITIIVLLILAGVTIASLRGDNGILTRAAEGKEKTRRENIQEQLNLWKTEKAMEDNIDGKKMNIRDFVTKLRDDKTITQDEFNEIETTHKLTIGKQEPIIFPYSDLNIEYFTYDFAVNNIYNLKLEENVDLNSINIEPNISELKVESILDNNIKLSYKPKDALGEIVEAKVKYKLKNGISKSVSINIGPASNVLYEENIFTVTNGDTTWNKIEGSTVKTVVDNESTVFGYTDSYKTSTGQFGGYTSNITEQYGETGEMTIDFTGRGFDLIASCGPNTGIISATLLKDGQYECGYIVDTVFKDDKIGGIYQVPVIHETGLEPVQYQLVVQGFGYGFDEIMGASTYSLQDESSNIYDIMSAVGFSEEEMENVEIIGADDIIGESTYALESKETTKNVKAATSGIKQVMVDALRVYRTSTGEETINSYPENEQNIVYTNVMEDGTGGNIITYVEPSKNSYSVVEYKANGGPENEIYLEPNHGVAFTFEGTENTPQISARLVKSSGSVILNDGTNKITIGHNTEMYYKVNSSNNIITILNEGPEILALGNIKSKSAIKALSPGQQNEIIKKFETMSK